MREIFDEISLSVIRFLEHHEGVSNVQFYEIGPISNPDAVNAWNTKNAPYELPSDFRAFLGISDGLLLKWSIFLGSLPTSNNDNSAEKSSAPSNTTAPVPLQLGIMHINSLHDVTPIPDEEFVAFALDSGVNANDGKVALVYDTYKVSNSKTKSKSTNTVAQQQRYYSKNQPQVWFQDLACEWHFIASNFTEYFRLMIMHLGLPHWQYAYTRAGLDPASLQWFRFLAPDRLSIDMRSTNTEEGTYAQALQQQCVDEAQEEKEKLEKQMKGVVKLNLKKISQVLRQDDKKEKPKPVTVDKKSKSSASTARKRDSSADDAIAQL